MLDGWMVGESGIKANSAQFSWSLAELGNSVDYTNHYYLGLPVLSLTITPSSSLVGSTPRRR